MKIYTETAIKQLCAKQDEVYSFNIKERIDEQVDVIACFDGHGSNLVIDIIRNLDLKEYFIKDEPCECIQQAIDKNINERIFPIDNKIIDRSGSTISFAKIYRNENTKDMSIHMEWLGDSPILVFINNELLFTSEIHSGYNEKEIERLNKRGITYSIEDTEYGFKIIDDKSIGHQPGKYVLLNNKILLAFTRSLGHGRITDIESQKHIINCSTEDEVKIVICSDGVGDILNKEYDLEKLKTYSAQEIVDFAEIRWKQEWLYENEPYSFPKNEYDDCSCVIWYQTQK